MLGMFQEVLDILHDHRGEVAELHKIITLLQEGQTQIMGKFDKIESDLSDLEAAVAAVSAPAPVEDDSADVAAVESRIEKLTADVKAKTAPAADVPAPVVPDPNMPAVAVVS